MAEMKRSVGADRRYRAKQLDNPPAVDIRKSILEMRRIYSGMLNADFVNWYSKRYGVKPETVWQVLEGDVSE